MTQSNKQDQHHWSGWPGACCLKCFGDDPWENALADGLWTVEDGKIVWLGTEEQKKVVEAKEICSVKGTLVWNDQAKKFDLHKEVNASEQA